MVKIIFKIDKEQDSKNWNRVIAIRDLPYGLEIKNVDNKMPACAGRIKDFNTLIDLAVFEFFRAE